MKKFLLLVLFVFYAINIYSSTDIIIFSYNRPMQLYALLESIYTYVKGYENIQVIFRASDQAYLTAYQTVAHKFTSVIFHPQGKNPHADLKPLTLKALQESNSDYILFAVDDNLVKDYVDLTICTRVLEKTNAYAFFLRFGSNTYGPYGSVPYDYIPSFHYVNEHVLQWEFKKTIHYWNYPHTVDMTIYRKQEVLSLLSVIPFTTPNLLESNWAGKEALRPHGLCFTISKIINLPLNRIQTDFPSNPSMDFATTDELLLIFKQGKKIDISMFHQIENRAPYVHEIPIFIRRNE